MDELKKVISALVKELKKKAPRRYKVECNHRYLGEGAFELLVTFRFLGKSKLFNNLGPEKSREKIEKIMEEYKEYTYNEKLYFVKWSVTSKSRFL